MNRQIMLAFLLSVSGTAFAAETEAAAELTETTNQSINTANSTENDKQATETTMAQKAKNWMRNYLVRKDKKRTALNVAAKIIAILCLHTSFRFGVTKELCPLGDHHTLSKWYGLNEWQFKYVYRIGWRRTAWISLVPAILAIRELTSYSEKI